MKYKNISETNSKYQYGMVAIGSGLTMLALYKAFQKFKQKSPKETLAEIGSEAPKEAHASIGSYVASRLKFWR